MTLKERRGDYPDILGAISRIDQHLKGINGKVAKHELRLDKHDDRLNKAEKQIVAGLVLLALLEIVGTALVRIG